MNKKEIEIWEAYDKYKTSDRKGRSIRDLKYSGELESLDRLSTEFLNNRSSTIRHEVIQVIEYLELKHNPEREKLKNYDELLKKYKLESVVNFEYKDFKKIIQNELSEEAEMFSSKITNKTKSGKQYLRFKLTDNIEGIVMLSLQPRGNWDTLQNLSYGFISNYRDFGGGYINNFPFDQKHYQDSLRGGFTLFRRERKGIFNYFDFVKELEKNLSKIDNSKPTESKYFREFNQNIGFNKELWFMLSLINIQKTNGQFHKMEKTIKEGLQIQDPKKGGSGWIKYYEEKLNIGSNRV